MDGGKDGVRCRDTIVDALDGGDTSGWIYDEGRVQWSSDTYFDHNGTMPGNHDSLFLTTCYEFARNTELALITSFSMTFFLAISLRYSRQYSSAVSRSSSSASSSSSPRLGTEKKQVVCEHEAGW